MALHWMEAAPDRSAPLAMDWATYELLEQAGLEVCIAMRRAAVLIGYAVFLLSPALHCRGRVHAASDAFYVLPAERRGYAGIRLIRAAEQALRAAGVYAVQCTIATRVRSRRGTDLQPLFHRLGYAAAEIGMRKRLD